MFHSHAQAHRLLPSAARCPSHSQPPTQSRVPTDGGGCSCGGGCPGCRGTLQAPQDGEAAGIGAAAAAAAAMGAGIFGGIAAGVAAGAAAAAATKTVSVDAIQLRGSSRSPTADIAFANTVFAPANVQFTLASNNTATTADSDAWLGGDTVLNRASACNAASQEELAIWAGATTNWSPTGRIRAFYVNSVSPDARGYSRPAYCTGGSASGLSGLAAVTSGGRDRTLAHEIGHILLNSGDHPPATDNLMHPTNTSTGEVLTPTQQATAHANA